MALENLQSQYGPTNKKGQKGTGVGVDTLAGEGEGNLGAKIKFNDSFGTVGPNKIDLYNNENNLSSYEMNYKQC